MTIEDETNAEILTLRIRITSDEPLEDLADIDGGEHRHAMTRFAARALCYPGP